VSLVKDKSGNIFDPDNYRATTISSTISKLGVLYSFLFQMQISFVKISIKFKIRWYVVIFCA